jgi:ParB-like chromosome segregation protein Spo0J
MTRKDSRLSDVVAHAFEDACVTLAVDALLPVRVLRTATKSSKKYQQITASIREVGLVEPPVVARDPTNPGTFLLLDGYVRIEVLKDLGIEQVGCRRSRSTR